jgi:hypothetical protein
MQSVEREPEPNCGVLWADGWDELLDGVVECEGGSGFGGSATGMTIAAGHLRRDAAFLKEHKPIRGDGCS